jgi:hypothetical protein
LRAAQRRVGACRRRELRQVADEQPPQTRYSTADGRSRPPARAASIASS